MKFSPLLTSALLSTVLRSPNTEWVAMTTALRWEFAGEWHHSPAVLNRNETRLSKGNICVSPGFLVCKINGLGKVAVPSAKKFLNLHPYLSITEETAISFASWWGGGMEDRRGSTEEGKEQPCHDPGPFPSRQLEHWVTISNSLESGIQSLYLIPAPASMSSIYLPV